MNTAQANRKARAAAKRREEEIEQEEIEGGEINIIPYLDIVTNLLIVITASISALVMGAVNVTVPKTAPAGKGSPTDKPEKDPRDEPLGLIVQVTEKEIQVFTTNSPAIPMNDARVIPTAGQVGDPCQADFECVYNTCSAKTQTCEMNPDVTPTPVFNYRMLNTVLYDLAVKVWGKDDYHRKKATFRVSLAANDGIPYATLISVMDAMRCKFPPTFETTPQTCLIPSITKAMQNTDNPEIDEQRRLYDPTRKKYNPDTDALFSDIMFRGKYTKG